MGVVFDEVSTQVETPPQPPAHEEKDGEQQSAHDDLYGWQRQQAAFLRRQQRLEAD